MIKEVLKQIHIAGVVNISEISQKVGVSPQMVEQALAVLQSKGYLKTVTCAPNSAGSCPNCSGCHGTCKASVQSTSLFFYRKRQTIPKQWVKQTSASTKHG
jgi:predicted transcriptional regulator